MKITEHTQDRLVIEDRPLFPLIFLSSVIALAFLGGVLAFIEWNILLGVFWFYVIAGALFAMRNMVKRRELALDRLCGTVSIGTKRLDGTDTAVMPLSAVHRAILEPDAKDPDVHDLALHFGEGPGSAVKRITDTYSGRSGIAPIVDTINDWLARAA